VAPHNVLIDFNKSQWQDFAGAPKFWHKIEAMKCDVKNDAKISRLD
jgi:hypothetical protein